MELNQSIFDYIDDNHYDYPKVFKSDHRIRLFEAFAGIGCQRMALNRLKVPYESVGISEIDKYSLLSYEAIHGDCRNYGDITKMTYIPECDIFTWSFPCTDLSKAGKQKGLDGTRSGLVYEVLRLLKATEIKPKVLIMENVVDLVQELFKAKFYEIQKEIAKLGYENHTMVLNGNDYGVAQNRERVFMVSILGGGRYEFPVKEKLEKRLKDYLEESVDEKYYLSEKMLNFFQENSQVNEEKGNGFRFKPKTDEELAFAITTRAGARMDDNFIQEPSIAIPEATEKGFALAEDGDGVYINRPHQKRGCVQKGMIQTLKTSGNDVGVVVGIGVHPNSKKLEFNGFHDTNCPTILATDYKAPKCIQYNNLRIRKLTPLECWHLMGIDDEDFYKAQSVCSNSQLYKQAGNGIIVDVFAKILQGLIE